MNNVILIFTIEEQERNFKHLFNAAHKLKPYLPIRAEYLEDDDIVEHIDQLIFRFMKAQDGIGKRLIPMIAASLVSNPDELTFIDKLNALEKYGLITREKWELLRSIRNHLAHFYPEEVDDIVDGINDAYEVVPQLHEMYLNMKRFVEEKMIQTDQSRGGLYEIF